MWYELPGYTRLYNLDRVAQVFVSGDTICLALDAEDPEDGVDMHNETNTFVITFSTCEEALEQFKIIKSMLLK